MPNREKPIWLSQLDICPIFKYNCRTETKPITLNAVNGKKSKKRKSKKHAKIIWIIESDGGKIDTGAEGKLGEWLAPKG